MGLIVDYRNIGDYLKNTAPYIFVDKAEVEVGKSAHGVKNFAHNEWYFQCHFPDDPIVPGVFQIEAITQTTALAIHPIEGMEGKKILLKKFVNIDFIHGVRPGDQLHIDANIISFKRGIIKAEGEAYIMEDCQKKITCKAEFQMIVPELFTSLAPR
jgi:3-hydroxyacyl-[acyl-carrier-protein] dehydratase